MIEMAVKKKGNKWYPVGKSGKLWKTGYATEAKAKKGLAQANKYFRSMKKPKKAKKKSGSKKTTKKKTTKKKGAKKPKKVIRTTKNRSWVGWARLGVYILATGGEAIRVVGETGFTKQSAARIAMHYTARDDNTKLSWAQAGQTYGPLAVVAIADTVASKLGVYKRMGSL